MLQCIVYVSSAVDNLGEADLEAILAKSRSRNQQDDITGLLLFHDGGFLQVLEGSKAAVTNCYDRIREDRRHTGTLCLFDKEVPERRFGDWSMAFVPFDDLDSAQKEGFVDLRKVATETDRGATSEADQLIRTFLNSFRQI